MTKQSKLFMVALGGLMALGLVFGGATAFAQSDDAVPTAPPFGDFGFGRGPLGAPGEREQALADELGITLEELQAAREEARIAMIDQAVEDGYLTEEQAEQLKTYGFGPRGHFGIYDEDEYLAESLGITVEELRAAELQVYEDQLAAAVEAGYLTQEQADLMLAQKAVQNYVDREALSEAVRAVHEEAINQALADGAITQAQADALLAQLETQQFGFGGRGGHGGMHGFGGMRGFGFIPTPGTTPDTTTDTGQGA